MHSRSLWLGPAMSSCSPTMPSRELNSLEESLLVHLYSRSPLMGGGGGLSFSMFLVLSQMQGVHIVLGH